MYKSFFEEFDKEDDLKYEQNQLGGQLLQERPCEKKKRQTMILEGISHGNPRHRKNREKTISDEIN